MAHATTTRRPAGAAPSNVRVGPAEALSPPQPNRARIARRLSVASASLVLAGGYVHLCLYRHGYRFIPRIGVSFLLQAASSAVLAVALLVSAMQRRLSRQAQLTRVSAIGLSVGTLAALGIAHTPGGLFNFHEIGLRPAPQTLIAIAAESLAAILLGVAMLEAHGAARSQTATAPAASPSHRAIRDAA